MTRETLAELKAELKHKVEVARPALAARLKAARELGDLSENADYISAKEEQGFLEGRIIELETIIRGAVIIGENLSKDRVQLGSLVTVLEDGEEEPVVYRIVGKVEANPRKGKISDESPLGLALIGCRPGDIIRYNAPVGEMVVRILKIG
jgi:transcription elongation factor GreA